MAVLKFRESDLFTEAEKAALEVAEAMTETPQRVTDDLFRDLQRYYSDAMIVELASVIALENFRSRFNRCGAIEPNGLYPQLEELLEAAGIIELVEPPC
ncbi:MAG: hypothetical protein CMJ45_09050 [Planctomyces sp.]|nr:hypothetical protein [Planctomyces sp.]